LFTFPGNWAGATGHTINPNGQNNPFDILTPLFGSINPDSVTASANNGPEVPTNAQGLLRPGQPKRGTLLLLGTSSSAQWMYQQRAR
jgi:hypothetical protein